jgi:lysophospholipase L1-like esterase
MVKDVKAGWRWVSILWALAAAGCAASAPATRPTGEHWVATWATAPQLTEPRNMPPAPGLADNTLRQALRVSIGGSRLRVRWSNEYGQSPMVIRAARLAHCRGGGEIDPASDRALTFNGQPGVTIPAGQAAVSDPLEFALQPMADVALTVWFGDVPGDLTGHPGSRTTSYLQPGNTISAPSMAAGVKTEHWYAVTGIDVVAPAAAAVAVLGNSITDGRGSTTDGNDRWPDMLSRRLRADPANGEVAVLNLGTGGNCVLQACLGPAGVSRYQRDILDQAGVRWVIVLEGVNDIGGARGPAASDSVARALIAAYQRMIQQAHARGLRVYGATITPFATSFYASPEHQAAWATVNAWIRTSGAFDAVIDFDAVVRDPADPTRLRPDVDTGDHLHPNALGYRLMGEAVPLTLFRAP